MLLSSAQTATYLKIFRTLTEKGTPCTVEELANPTGADVVFTGMCFQIHSHRLLSLWKIMALKC